MKVKHEILLSDEELSELFNVPAELIEIAFSSVEEQNAAIDIAKDEFKSVLCRYLQQAFTEGKKLGKFEQYEKTQNPE